MSQLVSCFVGVNSIHISNNDNLSNIVLDLTNYVTLPYVIVLDVDQSAVNVKSNLFLLIILVLPIGDYLTVLFHLVQSTLMTSPPM